MTSPVNGLLQALHLAVKADAALSAALGGEGLADRRQRGTRFPVLLPGAIETRDFSTGDSKGHEILMVLELWSEISRREAEALASDLGRVAEALPAGIGALRLVNLVQRGITSRREAKTGLFVAEMRLRAVVE
ncbi:DUF3168 domain-containing protein [Rhizobium sp. AAP43]|uniref:DUF3168 domain-containing protein n=1 Tax=Rhizobium sp. AAP43 TaxID=1523420 RepID=UPI0006B99362|nr:DUF3168 domain-containing protein [Rhizobium sp. AAP43]KPF41091.1 hypothetical protein IP76_22220 [Rhizobium sp. AAP43]